MPFEPLHLVVLAPTETLLEADRVEWVRAQLADGAPIGIYPGHAPLLAETQSAPLRYADARGEHALDLAPGFLWVGQDQVTVLTHGDGFELERERQGAEDARFDRLARELLTRLRAEPDADWGTDERAD